MPTKICIRYYKIRKSPCVIINPAFEVIETVFIAYEEEFV